MRPKDRPMLLLALAAFCLLATSLLPIVFKSLFVEQTGHYTPLAPSLAAALFIAFVFHKDLARKLTLVLCTLLSLSLVFLITVTVFIGAKYVPGLVYLLLLQVVTIRALRDRQVKDFVK